MAKGDGWVKIHRKILNEELNPSQFKFFVGAILLAKSPKSRDSGLVDLSVRQLATELRMSRSEVWRREKQLEAMGMLTVLNKGFIINNYHYYQTGKTVPPTRHPKPIQTMVLVPPVGQQPEYGVPPVGQSVPPVGQSVPPVGQSVPSHIAKSAHKNNKNHKTIKKTIYIPYPEYPNVNKITKDEHQKLIEKFGEAGAIDRVESLSLYIASKGDKYKNHYATILAWDKRDKKGGQDGTHRQSPRQLRPRGSYTRPEDL